MDFSTSVFVYPLHAVSPYPEISCFTRPKGFTRPQDLTRALAPYTQQSCLTRPQALTRASALYTQRSLPLPPPYWGGPGWGSLHPIHQPSHSFIEGPRFHVAQLGYSLQHLIGLAVVIHPSDDIVYSRSVHKSNQHDDEELYCYIGT